MNRFVCCILSFFSATLFAQTTPVKTVHASDVVEYTVSALTQINTEKAEFAPVPYKQGIVFVSEQKKDLVNFENLDPDGHPFLDLFYAEKTDGGFKKKKSFSKKHNSEFHDGPISFNRDFTIAFLTRANYTNKRKKNYVNQSKLYILKKKGSGWSKPEKFKYDSDTYSLGHASVTEDGKYLFFASDMPGGFGGTDLYVCEWSGTEWGAPVNLGPKVNSLGNELYPFIRNDGVLFFSSDRPSGLGGLDVYSAEKINNSWKTIRNEGININSAGDDFGIVFSDFANGYISSNRDGSDNIFSFVFTKKFIDFEGFVLNSDNPSDPSVNIKVELTDSLGNKINETRTDDKGYFKFHSLNSDESYLVKIDETDSLFSGMKRYYLADKNHTILRITGKKGNDNFVFNTLAKDSSSVKSIDEDDVNLAGKLLLSQNPVKPLAETKVVLKDKNGNIIDEATTNESGSFVFTKIPPDGNYIIEIAETDTPLPPNTKIVIADKDGHTIKTLTADNKGKYSVHFLEKDKEMLQSMVVSDTELLLDLNPAFYDETGKPIDNLVVFLKDEDHKLIDKDTTDNKGRVSFRKLLTDKNYIIEFDESDERLGLFKKIIVKSHKGKIVREIIRQNDHFDFHILKSEKSDIKEVYTDDPWLAALTFNKNNTATKEITIEERVFYDYGSADLDEADKLILEKVVAILNSNAGINIEVSSHTDAQSSAGFNLSLSKKRAHVIADYLVSRGISASRIKTIGYGETRLKNKCSDGVVCTEAEHALNRRTEFRFYTKKK